ncbi:PorP/SprF family type IX secretion system membrane protein [Algibacter sp. L4_22]|uniref:PorP/SprF family type IX secretion system membrane protein n=1 Tax=Algibacter sp. L4_22 TaxID=2942477 RepID=UPI00201B7CC2|nr:PorP/SprF family type IX secretion system membrane protein [Algibacter sp. L4_22]MCL5128341.1 PorP/SprF family type IX secretion system membrane protein [Algibacter sp. L4_22]
MKKYILHTVLFLCLTTQVYSQENDIAAFALPVRNSLKFNKYALNPTFSFVREQNKYISITNKRQWVQFENSPENYLLSYSGRFSENIGAGIGLFQQNIGVFTNFGGVLNFAYNAVLNRDSNLTFGTNIAFYQSGINEGKVVSNYPDSALNNIEKSSVITINPGLNYGTKFLDFGVAINNLVSYNMNSSELIEENPEQSVQGHIMYTGYIQSRGFFDESKFSGLVRSEFKKDETVVSGIMMLAMPKGIWTQVGYNTLYGVSAGLGLNVSNSIAIEYNYEKSMGELSGFGNSHEITLAYKFKKKFRYDYSDDEEETSLFSPSNKPKRSASKQSAKTSESDKEKFRNNRVASSEVKEERKVEKIAEVKAKAEEVAKTREIAREKAKTARVAKANQLAYKLYKAKQAKEAARAKQLASAQARAEEVAKARQLTAEQAKAEEVARAKQLAEEQAKAEEVARAKQLAEEQAKAEEVARAKQLAEEKAKAEEVARAKQLAEEKAKAEEVARANKLTEEQAKAEAAARAKQLAEEKAKAEEVARAKQLADEKAKAEEVARANKLTEEQAKAEEIARAKQLAEEKAKAEEIARAKQLADEKAKAEEVARANKLTEEQAKAEEIARAKQLADEKAKAEEIARAKQLADEKAKAEEIARAKQLADEKAKALENQPVAVVTPQPMIDITKLTDASKIKQEDLLSRLNEKTAGKQKDLDDLKKENDLRDKGIVSPPKPFRRVSEENAALEALKIEVDDVISARTDKIKEIEDLYNQRRKKVKSKDDPLNIIYLDAIELLYKEQKEAKETKERLVSTLERIKIATDIERKRRIKKADYENEEDRFKKDRAALARIKNNTEVSTEPLTESDFDFGKKLSNIQIMKGVDNVESGYYLVVAVHSDVAKRDAFLAKAVAAGQSNIDFFYDVNSSNYFIYYQKFDDIEMASRVLLNRNNKPYDSRMSMVKIEN